jgi:UDP-N-acetylglucosamine 1-carboxyvinyltransferase
MSDSQKELTLEKRFIIKGGNKLFGEIQLSGAKNAALPMVVAACLGEEPTELTNVPIFLRDVTILINILKELGADINIIGNSVICKRGSFPNKKTAPDQSTEIRYSLLLLGLASALSYDLNLPVPGGCKIGDRKYDLHLMGLRKLGAIIEESDSGISMTANKLIGNYIEFYLPTTSGTENMMIASVMAEGETTIMNANTRPEIIQLAEMMRQMGADITCSNRVIKVKGKSKIIGGASFSVMPGWDEAMTYVIAAAVTNGEICIPNFNMNYIKEDVRYLNHAGVKVFEWGSSLYVSGKDEKIPFDLFTAPYPGINSDMQPIFAVLALTANGMSTICDLRFTDRFQYVNELQKFGADIHSFGNTAVITGGKKLIGNHVRATDLRGGAACVLTALISEGESIISNVSQIERGYENMTQKLSNIGANIYDK